MARRWFGRSARRLDRRFGVSLTWALRRLDRGQQRDHYEEIFKAVPVPVAVLDADSRVTAVNDAMLALLGESEEDVKGRPVSDLVSEADGSRLFAAAARARSRGGHPVVVDHWYRHPEGGGGRARTSIRRLSGVGTGGWVVLAMEDLTREQEALEEQRRVAEQDPLTGLLNRRGGDLRLRAALERMVLVGPVAVIICDADGLKQINDRYGHGSGDEALLTVARRLRGAVRGGDDVARMGGDEFIVVARVAGEEEALAIAERCVRSVAEPLGLSGGPERVTLSAGVAVAYPGHIVDPGLILAAADGALYEAKRAGGNRWHQSGPVDGEVPGSTP